MISLSQMNGIICNIFSRSLGVYNFSRSLLILIKPLREKLHAVLEKLMKFIVNSPIKNHRIFEVGCYLWNWDTST